MDHAQQLGKDRIDHLLWRFSLPAIVGMLVQALYNVVDRIFIGRAVGSIGIAGITAAFPMMIILMGFGMLIGIGANSLISIRLGQQRTEDAQRVLGNAMVLFFVTAVIITSMGLTFMTPLLELFGASAEVLPYSTAYLRIILMGSVFQLFGFGMNNFIRGEGNPKAAMITMIFGAGLNMTLDPILIFGLDMGIQGAAVATVISQGFSAVLVLSYFLGHRSLLKIRRKNLHLDKGIVSRIFAVGSAPFAMQVANSVMVSILNHQLCMYGGTVALSVMGILFSILMLILMPVVGISQGAQPIIGYNYGAANLERVIRTVRLAVIWATGVTLAGFIVIMAFPSGIIALFNRSDTAMITMGSHAAHIMFVMLPVVGVQIVSSNYFQAVGKARHALLLSMSRQILMLIPALLILPCFFGINGVWMAIPVSDAGSLLVASIFVFAEMRHLRQRIAQGNNRTGLC
ncbi:MAG: MATE family efflux transporter [Thermodesulfobacteriota bacterium]|nr:MATE family efflux transporter [Thermodesulfobacteriota bacterium]